MSRIPKGYMIDIDGSIIMPSQVEEGGREIFVVSYLFKNEEKTMLQLTNRELKEIQHALYYADYCNHGTVGHNILIIVAKMAKDKGFWLDSANELHTPENVIVEG